MADILRRFIRESEMPRLQTIAALALAAGALAACAGSGVEQPSAPPGATAAEDGNIVVTGPRVGAQDARRTAPAQEMAYAPPPPPPPPAPPPPPPMAAFGFSASRTAQPKMM